jgi:hypothetical protein
MTEVVGSVQAMAVFELTHAEMRGDVLQTRRPDSLQIARAVIDAARKPAASTVNAKRTEPVTPRAETAAGADTGSQDWASF